MRRTPNQLVMLVGVCLASFGTSHSAWADGGGCMADLDGCGTVDSNDLLLLLQSWGPCRGCNADFNDDGVVDGEDLGYQLGHWGPCVKNLRFPTPAPIELVIVEITDPETESQGLKEFDLFAAFDEPTDRLLNVLNANATCDDPPCWVDHQFFPSALPLPERIWDIFDLTYDCYVTVGLQFLDDNAVTGDPSLVISEQDFVDGIAMGPNAGWFLAPFNDQGLAGNYPDNQIRIASFTTPVGKTIEGELSIIYQDDADQLFIGSNSFVISSANDCPWDLDNDRTVGASDLLALLASWGPCKGCPADFDDSGSVGASDLLALLANWGPCP
ncbi:MAG: hypothetical protein V3T53_04385 [Phycisphaerales bacterium]